MTKAFQTREKLLVQARNQMWARGYSNVTVREIAQSAGVDVALISRYFGSKRGLFEASIEDAFRPPTSPNPSIEDLIETVVLIFTQTPRDRGSPSVVQLMVMNAHEDEVGEAVRRLQAEQMQSTLEEVIGDKARAALFMAAILGISIAEKTLHLEGIAPFQSAAYEAQLRHMLTTALAFPIEGAS